MAVNAPLSDKTGSTHPSGENQGQGTSVGTYSSHWNRHNQHWIYLRLNGKPRSYNISPYFLPSSSKRQPSSLASSTLRRCKGNARLDPLVSVSTIRSILFPHQLGYSRSFSVAAPSQPSRTRLPLISMGKASRTAMRAGRCFIARHYSVLRAVAGFVAIMGTVLL